MRIPFIGGAYSGRSGAIDAQTMVNYYVEGDPKDTRSPKHAVPTPGLTLVGSVATPTFNVRSVRGLTSFGLSTLYGIIDSTFYEIDLGVYTVTSRGTVDTVPTNPAQMQLNGLSATPQILITDSTHAYVYTIGTHTLTQLASPVPFGGVCTQQDSYAIMISTTSLGEFVWSSPLDFSTWPGLSFATKQAFSDTLNSVISDGTKLYLLGGASTEVWYDAGQQNQAFFRIPGAVFKIGCAIPQSPGIADNSLIFVGTKSSPSSVVSSGTPEKSPNLQIYQMRGAGVPVRISTPQIEWQLEQSAKNAGTNWSQYSFAFTYRQNGHEFYVLHFISSLTSSAGNMTWVYDVTTQEWHQRTSTSASSLGLWLAAFVLDNGGTLYALGFDGNLYTLDPTNNTENGAVITRTITSPHLYGLNEYVTLGRVEVITNNAIGSGPTSGTMTLSWSRNYSSTFTNSTSWTFIGSPTQRFYWNRLGRARDWVFQLTTTQNPIILDLMAHAATPEEEAAAGQSNAR